MDIDTARAHLRILGFTIHSYNYTTQHTYRNPKTGMRLLYIITPPGKDDFWIQSLMTKDMPATKRLANFLNGH